MVGQLESREGLGTPGEAGHEKEVPTDSGKGRFQVNETWRQALGYS